MKIAIVAPYPDFSRSYAGGAMGAVIRHMSDASAYKRSIRIFTEHTEDPFPNLDLDMMPPSFEGKRLKWFAERLRRYAPDIIEAHYSLEWGIRLAKHFPLTPTLAYLHYPGRHAEKPYSAQPFLRRMSYVFLLRCVVGVSDWICLRQRNFYPVSKKKIVTIHNAIPFAPWLGDAGQKEKLILYAARAAENKGFEAYVEGIAEALPSLSGWRAAVLTAEHSLTPLEASETRAYRMRIQERYQARLGERCEWVQNALADEVASWKKRAAIFVAPSIIEEAFCLSALEAHIAGAAVVSSGRGGLPEVSGKEGAWYLPEVSGRAVADALRHLAAHEEERLSLAKRGQAYVLAHHRIEDRAAEMDALRRELTGKS